jgi:2',3'-cyclic-nucleotide 2'-phosphodiesterase (5'-nucleotidase family)
MKRLFRLCLLLVAALFFAFARPAAAQSVGKASADFPNLKPNRQETPWGRLVADALQSAGKADIAVINAGALRSGTLEAGPIEATDIASLLSFGEDDVVTLTLSGVQIRSALERAASAYPTGSPAFLHCAGIQATFDINSPSGKRVTAIKVKGRNLDDQSTYSVAMPVSLSEGAAGYFNIWSGAQAKASNLSLQSSIADYIKGKGEVSPEAEARFGPG